VEQRLESRLHPTQKQNALKQIVSALRFSPAEQAGEFSLHRPVPVGIGRLPTHPRPTPSALIPAIVPISYFITEKKIVKDF
jgi:hypothetical protein